MREYTLRKGYHKHAELRKQFHELLEKTFCLSFEEWYQNGYWKEQYNQYTLFDAEKAISSVSAYKMKFDWSGYEIRCVQFGGVMTDEAYRNQGLSRIVMEEAIKDYIEQTDDIFLLANRSVLQFYPKFGFHKCRQWQCSKDLRITTEKSVVKVPMNEKKNWKRIENAVRNSVSNSLLEMKNNPELIMFYLIECMQENVYYIESLDAYVIAEQEENELNLIQVISSEVIELNKVYEAFGSEITHVTLGFTPLHPEEYEQIEIVDPDDTFFIMGKDVEQFQLQKIMVPVLSHT